MRLGPYALAGQRPSSTGGAVLPAAGTVAQVGAADRGSPPAAAPAVSAIAAAGTGGGYYVLRAGGEVAAYDAPWYGAVVGSLPPGVTATAMAVDPATRGYWVVSSMGRVWAFHAPLLGRVNVHPGGWGQYPAVVAMAAGTGPAGPGYYLLRANGRVRAFGLQWRGDIEDHIRYGATAPVVATGMAVDPLTGGYWILTSDGGVYAFDAPWLGSPSSYFHGWDGVQWSGIAALRGGAGYVVVAADGRYVRFGGGRSLPRAGPGSRSPGTTESGRLRLPIGAAPDGVAVDASSGGLLVSIDYTPLDGYLDPLRAVAALVPQEIDQGVDYCGTGPVYAVGPGVVLNTANPGWPGGTFISYRLSAGPAKGLIVYVAENVAPDVEVGETVTATTVLGVLHDSGTCMETGWANPADPYEQAAAHFEYTGTNSTAYGLNFSSFLERLGARPGLVQPLGRPGPLPSSWPRW